ncbi:uncharacterized protein LOC119354221 isoform X4 [Triticum dicoccoides]|uniref:uncharacterized protein LOC119354221 isoform X4 n=1 Tax=Triticum dicoccoides TaxID=85692 RepID=UPI00188F0A48|nr:uncharacterized protein LOC119354221 isoform X4 [Triticum dicoccoides]
MRGRTRRIRASTTTRWGLRRLDTFEVLPRAGEYRCSTLRRCQAPGAGGRETLSCRPPRGAATGRRSCCRTPLSDATGRRRCDHDDVPDKNRRQACWRASGRIGEHPLHVQYQLRLTILKRTCRTTLIQTMIHSCSDLQTAICSPNVASC